ncbi:MAG: DNA alkylation repair protein [Candidatus Micrarchaeota archaeon]|nr:DNA alkylation repair protein [Candidatus Micrarchaeota archaeon]
MSSILLSRLRAHARPSVAAAQQRFFKEDVKPLGLYVPQVRAIVREFVRENPAAPAISSEMRALWSSGYLEARMGAILLAQFSSLSPLQKLSLARRFLKDPRLNWALCDAVSGFLLGPLAIENRTFLTPIRALINGNRWERRACVVALILPMRRGVVSVRQVLALVRVHLYSNWDYSQKACGWVLRECYKKDAGAAVRFMAGCRNMPRTAFSYACERMEKSEKLRLKKKVYG